MAENPYAKYVSTGNPYAKYAKPQQEAPSDKQEGNLGTYLAETGANIIPSGLNLARGVINAVGEVGKAGVGAVLHPLKTAEGLGKYVWDNLTASPEQLADDPIAKGIVGYAKTRYGSVDAAKKTFHDDPVGFLADVSTVFTGLGGAARGGAEAVAAGAAKTAASGTAKIPVVNLLKTSPTIGKAVATRTATPAVKAARTAQTAQKVVKAAAVMSSAGNAINPLEIQGRIPVVKQVVGAPGAAAKAVTNAFLDIRDKKTAVYRNALGPKLEDARNALRNTDSHQIVPGSLPTAAEAVVDIGSTGLSELQNSLSKSSPRVADAFNDRMLSSNKARLDHIGEIAGSPSEVQSLKDAREATTNSMYKTAKETSAPGTHEKLLSGYGYDPRLQSLLDRPAITKAFAEAGETAANKGKGLFVKIPISGFKAEKGPSAGKLTGDGAHEIKLALDDMILKAQNEVVNPATGTAAKQKKVAGLVKAKTDFLNWAEEHIPDYKTARETYADLSKPINQMEIGQHLKDELGKALDDKTAAGRHDKFNKTMDNAPKIIKTSLNEPRYQELSEILTPDELAKTKAVLEDLARSKRVERLTENAADGPKVQESEGRVVPWPSAEGVVVHTANRLLNIGSGKISRRMAIEIGLELVNPSTTADALDKVIADLGKRERGWQRVSDIKEAATKAPAVYNMLAPKTDSTNALR